MCHRLQPHIIARWPCEGRLSTSKRSPSAPVHHPGGFGRRPKQTGCYLRYNIASAGCCVLRLQAPEAALGIRPTEMGCTQGSSSRSGDSAASLLFSPSLYATCSKPLPDVGHYLTNQYVDRVRLSLSESVNVSLI